MTLRFAMRLGLILLFLAHLCAASAVLNMILKKEWVMSGTTKVTTTRTDGWQDKCRRWAEAGESFEIRGVGASHLAFCKELCESFNYECHYQSHDYESAAVFTPS
jgi:hypothetical protein